MDIALLSRRQIQGYLTQDKTMRFMWRGKLLLESYLPPYYKRIGVLSLTDDIVKVELSMIAGMIMIGEYNRFNYLS